MNAPRWVDRARLGTGFTAGLGVGLLAPVAVRSLVTALRPGPRDLVPLARVVARASGVVLREARDLLRTGGRGSHPAAPPVQPTATWPPTRAAA